MKSNFFTLILAATLLAPCAFSQLIDLGPSVSGSVVSNGLGFSNSPEIVAAYAKPGGAYRPPSNAYLGFQLPSIGGIFGSARLQLTINGLGLGQAAALRVSIRDVSFSSIADLTHMDPLPQTYEDLGSGVDYNSIFPIYVNAADFRQPLTFELSQLQYVYANGGVALYLGIAVEPLYYSSGYHPEFPDNGWAVFIEPSLHVFVLPNTGMSGVPEPSTYGFLMVGVLGVVMVSRRKKSFTAG